MSEYGERELIVIVKAEFGVRATAEGVASATGADVHSISDFLASENITIQPLFSENEDRLLRDAMSFAAATGVELPDLSKYYRVVAPDARLDEVAENIRKLDVVESAYVKPPSELPRIVNVMTPSAEEAPPATPDFTSRQDYLDPAPTGVDAQFAWTILGGKGKNVKIIDIEGAWRFTHEDLIQNQGGIVGTPSTDLDWENHGTAVVGEIGGDINTFGVTGIASDAYVRAVSVFGGLGVSGAIRKAADMLSPGDIILIEIHRAGPRYNFQPRLDQKGYVAVEWWPDDFDAIRYAVAKGIIVVEPAGNGAENLDDAIYNTRPAGFPPSWRNPFNPSNPSSDAVVVGAGNPPPGTHGRNSHPITGEPYVDRARCAFSNYGSRLDAQGWGWEVTTTGYGDLQGGSNRDHWYTNTFGGTSSASPIVVGALACVQGILCAQNKPLLTPVKARECLRKTGSPQQTAPDRPASQRIGNRPDIKQLIPCAGGTIPEVEKEVTYQYAVKFVCGTAKGDLLAPGDYWTAINVHNPTSNPVKFRKKIAIALPGERPGPVTKFFDARLGPDQALEIDRKDIFGHAEQNVDFLKGFVIIESKSELDIVAVYTATGGDDRVETMFLERVNPRRPKPDLIPVPDEKGCYCKREGTRILIVTVKNQGVLSAGPSTTRVDFGMFGTVTNKTPSLAPGQSVDLKFQIPLDPNCYDPNCEFTITVDADDDVNESDEGNNTASGTCKG